jgi:hypothetical protein
MKTPVSVILFSTVAALASCSDVPPSSETDRDDGEGEAGTVITIDPESTTYYADEPAIFQMPKVRATRNGRDVTDELEVFYSSTNVMNQNRPTPETMASEAEFLKHAPVLAASHRYGWEAEQFLVYRLAGDDDNEVVHPIRWLADREAPIATSNDITHEYTCIRHGGDRVECDIKARAAVYENDYVVFDVTDDPRAARPRLLGKIIDKQPGSVSGTVQATVRLELPMTRYCKTDAFECDMHITREAPESAGEISDSRIEYDPSLGHVTDFSIFYRWYYQPRNGGPTEGFTIWSR